ncbi:unnamed protein product [Cladocopium goreaui]|uniref:Copia protein n=1 Tax=Cladocopium goreaui TaxID=2562237 RepID=A0A9P1G6C9_9DINO|nr:unnamed protein product [Cladocopium goreaui]
MFCWKTSQVSSNQGCIRFKGGGANPHIYGHKGNKRIGAIAEIGASLKYFFGGVDVDHREYNRWKQWVIKARGSFAWTLLQGRALKVVEHLSDTDYQGGDEVISKLLDERWPQKERSDEMGEHISEIFGLKAKDCETVRQWCGRARECFDPCKRKAGASFPDEARRWILFQCSGLNEEKRAVVLARTQGELKFHTMALSMRSYYPDFVVSRRKSAASAHLVEPRGILEEDLPPNLSEVDFQDVELFLTECGNEADAALRALILAKDFFRFAKVFASPKVSKAWRLHSISLLSSPLSLMAEELSRTPAKEFISEWSKTSL